MSKVCFCECGLEITADVEDLLDKGFGITCRSCGADILSREDRAAYSYLGEEFSIVSGDGEASKGIWLFLDDVPVRDLEAAFNIQAQAGAYHLLNSVLFVLREHGEEEAVIVIERDKKLILKRFRERYIDC